MIGAPARAIDGIETGQEHSEEGRSASDYETDELVDIVPRSSASSSVHPENAGVSGNLRAPMGPQKWPLAPDQTQGRSRAAVRLELDKSPGNDTARAPTAAQRKRHSDEEGSFLERRKRTKMSNTEMITKGEGR